MPTIFGDSFDSLARQAENERRSSVAQFEGALNRFITVGSQRRREESAQQQTRELRQLQQQEQDRRAEQQRSDRLFSDVFNAARQGQLGQEELAPFLGQFDSSQQQALTAAQRAARAQEQERTRQQAAVAASLNQALIEPFEQDLQRARRDFLTQEERDLTLGERFRTFFGGDDPREVENEELRQQALLAADTLREQQRQAALEVATDPRLSRQVVLQGGRLAAISDANQLQQPVGIDPLMAGLPPLPAGVQATPFRSQTVPVQRPGIATQIAPGEQGGIPRAAGIFDVTGLGGLPSTNVPPEMDTSPFFDAQGANVTFDVDGAPETIQRSDVAFFDRTLRQIAAELVSRGIPAEDAVEQATVTARQRLANIIRVEKENGTR